MVLKGIEILKYSPTEAGPLTDDDWEWASFERKRYWEALIDWAKAGRVTDDELRVHLLGAWVGSEWPRNYNGIDGFDELVEWERAGKEYPEFGIVPELFQRARYLSDVADIAKPTEPLQLYRGCTENGIHGMSWTTELEKARWFAKRETLFRDYDDDNVLDNYGLPVIATVTVPPAAILAMVLEARKEREVIIDPTVMEWESLQVSYDLESEIPEWQQYEIW